MPVGGEDPDENHARRFLDRVETLTRRFRDSDDNSAAVLQEFDRCWSQVAASIRWASSNHAESVAASEWCIQFAACCDPAGGNSPIDVRCKNGEIRSWNELALAASRQFGWTNNEAGFLYRLASVELAEFNFAPSQQYAEQALQSFRLVQEERGIATTLDLLGLIAVAKRDYAEAIPYLVESLATYRSLALRDEIAFTLSLIAQSLVGSKDFDSALSFATEARNIAKEIGNVRTERGALRMMAHALSGLGRQDDLREICDAASSTQDIQQSVATSATALGLFDVIRSQGTRSPMTFDLLNSDLASYRFAGNWNGEAFTLYSLGVGNIQQGDIVSGRAYLQQALAVFTRHEHQLGISFSEKQLRELGQV